MDCFCVIFHRHKTKQCCFLYLSHCSGFIIIDCRCLSSRQQLSRSRLLFLHSQLQFLNVTPLHGSRKKRDRGACGSAPTASWHGAVVYYQFPQMLLIYFVALHYVMSTESLPVIVCIVDLQVKKFVAESFLKTLDATVSEVTEVTIHIIYTVRAKYCDCKVKCRLLPVK